MKVRYGHRIFSPFPFWACLFFQVYSAKSFHENVLQILNINWLYPVYYIPLFGCLINYVITHFKNPGVLPWNWSETQKKSYTSAEMRNGIASRIEQFEWAAQHPIPARAAFSRRWGFWILRGDHDCFWVNNWIGIGNHRYFLSATIFGTFLFLSDLFISVYAMFTIWSSIPRRWNFILTNFGVIYIGLVNVNQMLVQIRNVSRNDTIYERLVVKSDPDAPSRWDRGCWSNWEEVCGPRKYCLLWLLPIPLPAKEDGFGFASDTENAPFLSFN